MGYTAIEQREAENVGEGLSLVMAKDDGDGISAYKIWCSDLSKCDFILEQFWSKMLMESIFVQ